MRPQFVQNPIDLLCVVQLREVKFGDVKKFS